MPNANPNAARQSQLRSSTSRLLTSQQESDRRLAASAAAAIAAVSPQAAEDEPRDRDQDHDSEENDRPGENQETEGEVEEDKETEGEADAIASSIPNNAAGDRAAERSPLIASLRDSERARIAAILRSPEAKANPRAAEAFALDSAMPRDQAIAMLKAIGPAASRGPGLNERMSGIPRVGPSAPTAEAKAAGSQATALAIVNAGRKTRGEAPLAQLPT